MVRALEGRALRAYIVSDLHGDRFTDGYERLDDVQRALRQVVQLACEDARNEQDVVFIALGDYTNPDSRNVHRALAVIADAAAQLSAADVDSYWLIGNHDVIEDGYGSHVLLALGETALQGVTVLGRPGPFTIWSGKDSSHHVRALALPYTALAADYDPEEIAAQAPTDTRVVLGHLTIPGILYEGSETHEMPRGRAMRFPTETLKQRCPQARLYNGHYHRRQRFQGIDVPGSLVRLSHGEEANPTGYLRVEL